MSKWILLSVFLIALCSGCEKKVFPSGRLSQPGGDFSYMTPEGWSRAKLTGVDFIIVSTNADYGIKPNIFVEKILFDSSLRHALAQRTDKNQHSLREFKINSQNDFETESGLRGIKIRSHHKTKQNLPLATFRYFIQDTDRIISITCTCADAVKSTYEPVFDLAMNTLQSERKTNKPLEK